MEYKTRKKITRIGSALMLGMSLFNLGALWGKQSGGILPRRSKLIRKQVQENVTQEQEELAKISEQEATIALQETLQEEQQAQAQFLQQTRGKGFFQQTFFYGAVGVWTIAAGLIFTSMIFNEPFSLGKGMMSLLPGQPHLASVVLEKSGDEKIKKGENFEVAVALTTKGDAVSSVRLFLNYDPSKIELENFVEEDNSGFKLSPESVFGQNSGQGILVLKGDSKEKNYRKERIAKIKFRVLQEAGVANISVNLERSLVLKLGGNGRKDNLLGRVSGVAFLID